MITRSQTALSRKDYRLVTLLTAQILENDVDRITQVKVLFMRGRAYCALAKFEKAQRAYTRIIEVTPAGVDQAMALSLRAEAYEKGGKADQALIDRDRIASLMS